MALNRTIDDDSWKDIVTKWSIAWFRTAHDSYMGFECRTEVREGTWREIVEYAQKVEAQNGYSGYSFNEIEDNPL